MTVHLQESSQTCNRSKSCVATWLVQGGAHVLHKRQGFPGMPSASLCVMEEGYLSTVLASRVRAQVQVSPTGLGIKGSG